MEGKMTDLAEFLLARIAEDERLARGTGPHSTRVDPDYRQEWAVS